MASGGSDRDAEYALSKLLQFGMVEDYQREFEKLMNRVTDIPESLLISYFFSGLKLHLLHEFFVSRPTTLGDAFSLARITDARYEDGRSTTAIAKPTSPILTIGGSQNKAYGSSTIPEVTHEVATEVALEVASIPENGKSNGVVSVLKDEGGEFDDDLDEINLGLSREFGGLVVYMCSLLEWLEDVFRREESVEVFSHAEDETVLLVKPQYFPSLILVVVFFLKEEYGILESRLFF
ncbi:hypothetical protein Tco_1041080 [Tanacetum coccineum]|uniref:Uncharacterized protein n=1 Tax=Tanacetum coccineum TaxID=301880 RepID=A0ABQ5GGN3_9ASTR